MRLKEGVRIAGLTPELVLAAVLIQSVLTRFGVELTITSALDGTHSAQSLHYVGRAIDVRSHDVIMERRGQLRDQIAEALGPEFDVVLESDHIHVELDPKPPTKPVPA